MTQHLSSQLVVLAGQVCKTPVEYESLKNMHLSISNVSHDAKYLSNMKHVKIYYSEFISHLENECNFFKSVLS